MPQRVDRNGFRIFDDPPTPREDELFDCDCGNNPKCSGCHGKGVAFVSIEEQLERNAKSFQHADPYSDPFFGRQRKRQ